MIVTSQFVFLHLHKSGGSFVNQFLTKFLPTSRQVGYHFPYTKLPNIFRNLPVLGTVRNPWDFYVSWYHFQEQMEKPNYLFLEMSKNNTVGFEQTIRNLLELSIDEDALGKIISMAPMTFSTHNLNLTKRCFSDFLNSGLGFYSCLYNRLYKNANDIHLIRTENLSEGLKYYLESLGVELGEQAIKLLNSTTRINNSIRDSYQEYYSASLQQQVLEKDNLIINTHDYSF